MLAVLPMRMELRPAVPEDALAVARVHVRAWQEAYRGMLPAAYLDGLRAEDRAARYTFGQADGPRTTVAILDAAVVGFATVAGDELSAINVDPSCWARGLGHALIRSALSEMAANGVAEARLWMLVGNARAQRFYERGGWTTDGTRRMVTVWGVEVDEIEYRRRL